MSHLSSNNPEVLQLLLSQQIYYDYRTDDYGNMSKSDRVNPGMTSLELRRVLIDEFRPTGNVLEIACGTGLFTNEIVRYASSVTALDASQRMLEINRKNLDDNPKVTYVNADIFKWNPDKAYDTVFFGFWLSHVPPDTFDEFWLKVQTCLAPNGRVAFVDEDERAAINDDLNVVNGTPTARRTLSNGQTFDIVKVFWNHIELTDRLQKMDWQFNIRQVEESFLYGEGFYSK